MALLHRKLVVMDIARRGIAVRNPLEAHQQAAVGRAPQAAIERPAAELLVVAIDDRVLSRLGEPRAVKAVGHSCSPDLASSVFLPATQKSNAKRRSRPAISSAG